MHRKHPASRVDSGGGLRTMPRVRRLLILSALLPACLAAERPLAAVPGTPLVLALPMGWSPAADPAGAEAVWRAPGPPGPEADRLRAALAIAVAPAAGDADALLAAHRADLQRLGAGALAVEEDPLVPGLSWRALRVTVRAGGQAWGQMHYLAVVGGSDGPRAVALVFSCPLDRLAAWRPVWAELVRAAGSSRPRIGR